MTITLDSTPRPTPAPAAPGPVGGRTPPTVCIMIPTKNRREDLLETLRSIAGQTRRPEQLVIIDQSPASCEDEVCAAMQEARELPVRYIWAPEISGLVAARERGIAESRADIVFFVDDDITLEPACIQHLAERYAAHPEYAGICGVDTGGADVPWWLVLARRSYMLGPFEDTRSLMNKRYRTLTEPQQVRFISGGLVSYRRWVFDQFQFEGRLWGHRWNSSIDFSYRVSAKYPVVIDPLVRVWHRKPYGTYSPEEFVRVRVSGTFFFFSRNVDKNAVGWVCFLWVLLAILVRSVWRGVQARALRRTLAAFFGELAQGFRFLRQPFAADY